MKKAIIAVIVLAVLAAAGTGFYHLRGASKSQNKDQFDFRKTRWGMSVDEVKASEGLYAIVKSIFDNITVNYFEEIHGKPVKLYYSFRFGSLITAKYTINAKHDNLGLYVQDYNDLLEILTQKYGEIEEGTRPAKSQDMNLVAQSVLNGQIEYSAKWISDTTQIHLVLGSMDEKILCGVHYNSLHTDQIIADKTASFPETEFDFRKTQWGMTKAEVMETEGMRPTASVPGLLSYHDYIMGLKMNILYWFDGKYLNRADYNLLEKYGDDDKCFEDYDKICNALTEKYGPPFFNTNEWGSPLDKINPSLKRDEIKSGFRECKAVWATKTTNISLELGGDRKDMSLSMNYDPRNWEEVKKQALANEGSDAL